jgi:RHS repeat-associated protein
MDRCYKELPSGAVLAATKSIFERFSTREYRRNSIINVSVRSSEQLHCVRRQGPGGPRLEPIPVRIGNAGLDDDEHDSLYRLQAVTAADSSWGIGWTFDAWGNRLTQTPSGLAAGKVGSQTLGYTNNRNTAFNYDNAGNQTSDASHNYTFNAVNQITQMDAGGAVYGYDGDGRRMKKTVGSETTYYFYAMGVLVSEFTTQNTGATAAASTDRTRYQTSDRLGTAVLIMDAAGLVVENNRTMPYGEEWLPAVASANEQKFTSYQRDGESGLDYAVARFFASTTGTLRSPDKGPMIPRLPATMNRYAYSLQDPINMTDPTGNVAQQVIRGLGCPSGIDYEIYIRYWEQVFSLKPTSASSHLRRLSIRTPQDRGAELEVAVP